MNRSNYDEIFIRNATLTLLELLSTELFIEQVVKDKIDMVRVKFMVDAGTSEQFMKDFFSGIPDSLCDVIITEGNYETLPFGVITMPPILQIVTKDLTSKFVRGKYEKKEFDASGKIHNIGYNARFMAIPLNLTFNVEIRVSTLNQLLKVSESLMDTFFQTRTTYFYFKGNRIPVNLRFPDQLDMKKLSQFDFSTQQDIKSVKFQVIADTYYPSFDKASLVRIDNTIERFNTATTNLETGQLIGDNNGEFTDQSTII